MHPHACLPAPLLRQLLRRSRPLSAISAAARRQPLSTTPHLRRVTVPTSPPDSALSALLSRVSLPPKPTLLPLIQACLTHPSYRPPPSSTKIKPTSSSEPIDGSESSSTQTQTQTQEQIYNNSLLSTLGNSLLGLFSTEYLSASYPHLPTEPLKLAQTAYVGPQACQSVARELGIGAVAGGNMGVVGEGVGSASSGVPIRWSRGETEDEKRWRLERRFLKGDDLRRKKEAREEKRVNDLKDGKEDVEEERREKVRFEEVVASAVRAVVGLIYQEQGIHAARTFVHAHFFSRHLDLESIFSFERPLNLLQAVIARQMVQAGVPASSGQSLIEVRLLASTGTNTSSPIFQVGLFLPSGLKLSEATGPSKSISTHRAATNALLSLFLVRGEHLTPDVESGIWGEGLPTGAHVDFPLGGGVWRGGEASGSDGGVDVEDLFRPGGLGTGAEEGVEGMRRVGRRVASG